MPRVRIPPGTDIPTIRQSPEGKRVLHLLRWSLVPHWTKDPSIGSKLNNARGQTVAEKPSFREAFKRRRYLVPASGFYEWKMEGKLKQPYYISLASQEPMAMAGVWESWTAPDGSILHMVCIVTTSANALMAPIHDRMPVIITPEQWQAWLNEPETAKDLVAAGVPAERLQAWPVSSRVSKVAEQDESLIEPLVC